MSRLPSIISKERKAGLSSIDDSNWAEVKHINCYAMFMGYLWLAMKGVSILVVTWNTVVLLGGFVSKLEKEDFWFLTVITLVQTAGIFDMHLSDNLMNIPSLCLGFLHTMKVTVTREGGRARDHERPCMPCLPAPIGRGTLMVRNVLSVILEFIQGIAFAIMLGLLAVIYVLGLYITCLGCVWRLAQHNYGSSDGDSTNKKQALYVLYTLGVFQGTILFYRIMLARAGRRIANQVADEYGFEHPSPVWGYLNELRVGCDQDTSFAGGRNLITYAVDLMELESPDDLLWGTRILDTLIRYDGRPSQDDQQNRRRMPMVIARLIGLSSSGKVFQKLLKALDSRSPCSTEMTKRATRIMLSLADDISLKQFPGGIRCISSLLDASLREVDEYKGQMLQGLLIIEKLATDEDNCRVMSDTIDLASMIMRPLSCNLLHLDSFRDHDEWSEVVDASLRVMCNWLKTATGESGAKLRSQITLNKQAISAMETILICGECHNERDILAMNVLTIITEIQDKEHLIVPLLGMFIGFKKEKYLTELAGEKLVMFIKESKSNAEIILEGTIGTVEEIISILYTNGNEKIRIYAAEILEGLCSHYVANELFSENLKRLIIASVPTALIPQIPYSSVLGERDFSISIFIDDALNGVQRMDTKFLAALLSLCLTMYNKMINEDDDLTLLLNAVSSKYPYINFQETLMQIVECHGDSTLVDSLRIVKYIAKVAKSMMRHKHIYPTVDLCRLMSSLDTVRMKMSHLDTLVHLSGGDGGDCLRTLVQDAHDLLHPKEQGQNPEVSIKEKESEITEQRKSSSGSSDGDTLSYLPELVYSTKEEEQPEVPNKGKEPEIIESSAPLTFEREEGQQPGDIKKEKESEIIELSLSAPCTTFEHGQSSRG